MITLNFKYIDLEGYSVTFNKLIIDNEKIYNNWS